MKSSVGIHLIYASFSTFPNEELVCPTLKSSKKKGGKMLADELAAVITLISDQSLPSHEVAYFSIS